MNKFEVGTVHKVCKVAFFYIPINIPRATTRILYMIRLSSQRSNIETGKEWYLIKPTCLIKQATKESIFCVVRPRRYVFTE